MFEQVFKETSSVYSNDHSLIHSLWEIIHSAYTVPGRKYHTLAHLENIYTELLPVKNKIKDRDVMVFSIAYHDIVYDILRSDNEERSAGIAVSCLKCLNVPEDKIENCRHQVLATKTHTPDGDHDTGYFTDADLSVLGYDLRAYLLYAGQVREEYRYYPDAVYKPGRRSVLKHFLDRERIFKTDHFYNLYEVQARMNLTHELEMLN